jgi:hypothetical protein
VAEGNINYHWFVSSSGGQFGRLAWRNTIDLGDRSEWRWMRQNWGVFWGEVWLARVVSELDFPWEEDCF